MGLMNNLGLFPDLLKKKKKERKNLSHSKLAVSSEFFGVKTSSLIGGLSRDNEDDH